MNRFAMLAAIAAASLSLPAKADYGCVTNVVGTTQCRGTVNGTPLNTTSYTDILKNTHIQGQFGDKSVNQTCYKNVLGNVQCMSTGF